MHEIFATAQRGLNDPINGIMLIAGFLSLVAFLFERHKLKDSDLSEDKNTAGALYAAAVVIAALGVIMLLVLRK
jgi:hypothetical protein